MSYVVLREANWNHNCNKPKSNSVLTVQYLINPNLCFTAWIWKSKLPQLQQELSSKTALSAIHACGNLAEGRCSQKKPGPLCNSITSLFSRLHTSLSPSQHSVSQTWGTSSQEGQEEATRQKLQPSLRDLNFQNHYEADEQGTASIPWQLMIQAIRKSLQEKQLETWTPRVRLLWKTVAKSELNGTTSHVYFTVKLPQCSYLNLTQVCAVAEGRHSPVTFQLGPDPLGWHQHSCSCSHVHKGTRLLRTCLVKMCKQTYFSCVPS